MCHRALRCLSGLLALALLAGCTPAACDPAKAEFFAGVGCAVSGSYDQRLDTLRDSAAAAQANDLQRQADAAKAEAEAAKARQDLDMRRGQLTRLDQRLAALQRQLDAARNRQGIDQIALRRAQDQLTTLRAQRANLTPQSDDSQLRALEDPTRRLSDELSREGL